MVKGQGIVANDYAVSVTNLKPNTTKEEARAVNGKHLHVICTRISYFRLDGLVAEKAAERAPEDEGGYEKGKG